jgi:hypothetical protein
MDENLKALAQAELYLEFGGVRSGEVLSPLQK